MKKILIVIGILVIVAAYVAYQHFASDGEQMPQANTATPTTPSSSSQGATPTTGSAATSYKDGSYSGDTTDAVYGPVQVQVTIAGGKISDVQFVQFPNAPGHTTEVSNIALPALKQEAIASQNAQVDIVSGATQTSQAFIQSLQSALAKAKA